MPTHQMRPDGTYRLGQYQAAPPFANFFPGIAGPWGRPLWVFYVNRGQAIASFGLRDKDHAILEFQPANKAYQLTPTQGFRTFIKWGRGRRLAAYEPFRPADPHASQVMRVTAADLTLTETHRAHDLETQVRYWTIPNEPVAALARVLTITNRSRGTQQYELLDGLPVIVPFGMSEWFLKHMSRTIEAWVTVTNLESHAPVFRLVVEPHDRPEVVPITEGNFYAAWLRQGTTWRRLPVIAEPRRVFGATEELATPHAFWARTPFRVPARQLPINQMPSALSCARVTLARGESVQVISLIGHTRNEQTLNDYLRRVDGRFIDDTAAENRQLIRQLQDQSLTVTASPVFDRYVQQTFLDNGLRGGFPVTLRHARKRAVFYLYGRKHGDLERDYNQFVLEPVPCSQGNANYRDANQNRRSDGWICPEAAAQNVITFVGLLQLDGFNPLVYTGAYFRVTVTKELLRRIRHWVPEAVLDDLRLRLATMLMPGDVLTWLDNRRIALSVADRTAFLVELFSGAERIDRAEHGEGFWSDHWTYNLDLLEQYAAIYPEQLHRLLFETRCTWFDNAHIVVPRSEKYILANGKLRQSGAVRADPAKTALIHARTSEAHCVRADGGHGDVYRSSVMAKLAVVVLNKLASLDPDGVGIEMEADKPNWYDALNGLPALFGSSISETCEVVRWLRWLQTALEAAGASSVALPVEAAEFMGRLRKALDAYLKTSHTDRDFRYWDEATTAKEAYREAVRLGVSGTETKLNVGELREFFGLALRRLERSISRALDPKTRVYRTYFWYEPTAYEAVEAGAAGGPHHVRIQRFKRHALPLFLEGNVHALRLERNAAKGRALHRAVTRSRLYDRKLQMFKVTEPLTAAPIEIGRARIFTPGWLEHESVWLHMEYKYLLELLRGGCAEEFFACFKRAGIPFQPPRRYGRSPLENSSFLVSSAYADPACHGRGFIARLTGATAEFLDMWRLMMVGERPFVLEEGRLSFHPQPILPAWLFTRKPTTMTLTRSAGRTEMLALPKGTVSCLLFGEMLITYHNPKRQATFGRTAVRPQALRLLCGTRWLEWADGVVPSPYAERLRAGEAPRLEVMLG